MKNHINKAIKKTSITQELDIRKKQKTKKRLFISIGGIVLSAVLVTSLTIGISIAKDEVK